LLFVAPFSLKHLRYQGNDLTEWRKQEMANKCKRLRLQPLPKRYERNLWTFKYFSKQHQYFYCLIPKVASSSWLLTLLTLAGGNVDPVNPHNDRIIDKNLKRGINCDRKERRRLLHKYYKFTFVRDPLDRLLSAYTDMMVRRRRVRGFAVIAKTIKSRRHKSSNNTRQGEAKIFHLGNV